MASQLVTLKRAQIGSPQTRYASIPLDITVKSATGWARAFAPTWKIVMEHKHGKIDDAGYTREYRDILKAIDPRVVFQLFDLGQTSPDKIVTLLCFCRDGQFCHTHLAVDYLVDRYSDLFIDGRTVSKT